MTDDDLKRLFASMAQENAAAHSETRRHFDFMAEAARKDIQHVAESVSLLSEKLARTDEKIDRTAAETQAMIRFSHVEIDRRMRTLEDAVADLQARVERLEGSAQ